MPPLPAPTPDAQAHSARLCALIRDEIRQAGGWISFARYMELTLYAPGLGYYSAGAGKFGSAGDFVTAPEISPLFGRCLARQAAQVLRAVGGDLLETGAGTGRLALQMLQALAELDSLPERYFILEVSADLRERQRALLRAEAPDLAERVQWLEALPERFEGMIFGNEVLDAMPVHLVVWKEDGVHERGVVMTADGYAWEERRIAPGPLREAAEGLALPPGYMSEVNMAAPAFVASLAKVIERGVLLFIDYGFGRSEYYHPQRAAGTLMCHYRHHAHDDPFHLPGLQDITAHVDFSVAAGAGVQAGLRFLGYTTQAHFLINCGLTSLLSDVGAAEAGRYLPLAAQAQKLVSPAEMGELFKVLALGKNFPDRLVGFATGDKSRLL